ncbi:MAG: indole-3-glycerol phosphate synthase TrpC [Gammaproteobacteria bacterium]|nr:MAG: indole-3-glycerol phosphate synthase TrpC [Gammaproteobacteria bacterium]RLA16085.1 MAG: indole-3-glycerol phosphate synthase TrpC [Gammaproteobacteria bacterium]
MTVADVLQKILRVKAVEIADGLKAPGLASMAAQAAAAPPARGFAAALESRVNDGRPGIIAEIKRASPSKGLIREDFDAAWIAQSYEAGGAACLSVLTDRSFFQGGPEYLQAARDACSLPVIRKDFVISEFQVFEARAMGADALLLIVAALDDVQLRELNAQAQELGLDVLVEVHDEQELERALQIQPRLLGVNNRDLNTFETQLETTGRIARIAPEESLLVSESGIHTSADVAYIQSLGVNAFLIGEAFMKAENPGKRIGEIFDGENEHE